MNIVSFSVFAILAAMIFFGISTAVFLGVLLFIGVSAFRKHSQKNRFLRAPFPEKWAKIIKQYVPAAAKIPRSLRSRYARQIKTFLMEKNFEACDSLASVSDKIAVCVAANASLLSLGRDVPAWESLQSVLIYPGAFRSRKQNVDSSDTLELSDSEANDGESNAGSSVILSQERILRDIAYSENPQNVIIHEFAHQFADTARIPFPKERTANWQKIFEKEMLRLQNDDPKTILDEYGADDPAEFFAVSTEAFFCTPERLRQAHRTVYEALSEIYALDPANW